MVRHASPADGPGIARLLVAESPHVDVQTYPRGVLPDGMVVLVAVDAGAVVGWLEGVLDGAYTGPGAPTNPPHGYVLGVVVSSAHRRSGVGSALLDRFAAEARTAGVRWVFLFPDESEGVEGRVRFFAAAGFVPVDDPDEVFPAMGRWA